MREISSIATQPIETAHVERDDGREPSRDGDEAAHDGGAAGEGDDGDAVLGTHL